MEHLADLAAERLDDAGERRRQLHDRLGGLELDDGLVDRHLVAGRDEPRDDLGLGEALAEVGEDEVAAHRVPLPGVERGEHAVGGRQVVLLELRRRERDVEAR